MASYAAVVESVDRRKLVGPLSRGAHQRSHPVDVLLQVSLDPPGREGRAGADPGELAELAAAVDDAGMLTLRGLMAVAPLDEDPAAAFGRLAEVRAEFLAHHPSATWLSAGMSADLEQAIAGRRDTRARWLCGPRFEALQQLVFRQQEGAASERGRRTRKAEP